MRQIPTVIFSLILLMQFSGCSIFMAAKQPDKKELGVLNAGISRDLIIAEFGMPISSDTVDGQKVETYRFVQGYSKGVKISRAVFHGVADFASLFIWELVAMPAEAIANGKTMMVKVTFDDENRVKNVNYLQT